MVLTMDETLIFSEIFPSAPCCYGFTRLSKSVMIKLAAEGLRLCLYDTWEGVKS